MTVKEIKKEIDAGKKINEILEIKKYIPFIEKRALCSSIIDRCMDYNEQGFVVCDYFIKQISLDVGILSNYTNFIFSENSVNDYDELVESGVLEEVFQYINPYDLRLIESMVDKEIQQKINIENSLSNVVYTVLNKFIDIVDKNTNPKEIRKMTKSLVKDLNTLNWDNIPQLKEIFDTVINPENVN